MLFDAHTIQQIEEKAKAAVAGIVAAVEGRVADLEAKIAELEAKIAAFEGKTPAEPAPSVRRTGTKTSS